jgi:hypothetical protein
MVIRRSDPGDRLAPTLYLKYVSGTHPCPAPEVEKLDHLFGGWRLVKTLRDTTQKGGSLSTSNELFLSVESGTILTAPKRMTRCEG